MPIWWLRRRADIKKQIFVHLDDICRTDAILASNTSSISITDIASATKHPERVVGMHFFNPATVMKLTELIRGVFTSDEVYAKARALAEAAGKTPVEVNECPGFVVNRLLIPMINEAIGRGHSEQGGYRHGHEAWLQPSHGPACACGYDRA